MEVIDFHTHIYPPEVASKVIARVHELPGMQNKTDGTITGLLNQMKEASVTKSIFLPVVTAPHQFEKANNYALEIAKEHEEIIAFGSIHPEIPDLTGAVHYLCDNGIKGFKVHPDYQGLDLDDPLYIKLFKEAAKEDMIVVTHSGKDPICPEHTHCTPDMILKVKEEAPDIKLVCAHVGARLMLDEVEEKLVGQDLYFDISRLSEVPKDQVKRIIENHGADRILYASDSPWNEMKENLEIFLSLGFDYDINEKILSGNAKELLNL